MEKILKKTNQERDEKELLKGEKKLLTVEDASLYLGIPAWTLRAKIWRREIPFIKLGAGKRSRVYFDRKDLDEWIEKNKIYPTEDEWNEED
ncbi:MAG: helix-turn-helix domain-containing protein [Ignavibacteriales bacterium]